jgi:ketosteroid isomerase-like protein
MQQILLTNNTNYFILQIISGAAARSRLHGPEGLSKRHTSSEPQISMSDHPMRGFARAFCDALSAREPARIAPLIHDDIDWTIFGPVDLFPFFGQRKGKAAVLAMFGRMADSLQLRGCDMERTLTDGAHAASLLRVTARDLRTGRTLSLRVALFAQFSGDRMTTLRAVFDTFDAVEQALGRHIDLSAVA